MSLIEIYDTLTGFYELEHERNQRFLEGVRTISFYALVPHIDNRKSRIRKPSDLFKLDVDDRIRRQINKDLKVIEVEIIQKNLNAEQSNG